MNFQERNGTQRQKYNPYIDQFNSLHMSITLFRVHTSIYHEQFHKMARYTGIL